MAEYLKVYTSVAFIESVRIILFVAIVLKWETERLNIKVAFLYALLSRPRYINFQLFMIEGVPSTSRRIFSSHKPFCGLLEAPSHWD